MWFHFGSEDIAAELRAINRSLGGIAQTLTRIERKQDITMALVAIEQNDLDLIATTIVQVAEDLQEVLDSDEDLGPADQSGIEAALTKLKAVGPRVPTDAPPVAQPVDPTDPTPGDGTPAPTEDPDATEVPVPVPNPDNAPVEEAPVAEVDDVAPVDPDAPVVTDPAAGDTVVTDPSANDAPVTDPAAAPPN